LPHDSPHGIHVNNLLTFPSGPVDNLSDADQERLQLMQRWQNEMSVMLVDDEVEAQEIAAGMRRAGQQVDARRYVPARRSSGLIEMGDVW
jgi:hypothetical protein